MSISAEKSLADLPDLRKLQVDRDRKIALRFVQLGETREARPQIHTETGIDLRTIYRAVERQLDWARKEHEKAGDSTGTGISPAGIESTTEVATDSRCSMTPPSALCGGDPQKREA